MNNERKPNHAGETWQPTHPPRTGPWAPPGGPPMHPAGAPPHGPPTPAWRSPNPPPGPPWPGPFPPPPPQPGPGQPLYPYPPSGPPTSSPRPRRHRWPWWVAGAVATLALVLVITLIVHRVSDSHPTTATAPSPTRQPASASSTPTTPPPLTAPPAAPALDPATLPDLLASAQQVGKTLNNAPMHARPAQTSLESGVSINPPRCASAVAPVLNATYAGSGYTGLAVQGLQEQKPGRHKVVQAVVAFPDNAAAQHFYTQQRSAWQGCTLTDATVSYTTGQPDDHAKITVVTDSEGIATTVLLPAGSTDPQDSQCERAMSARRNIIVDVRACGPNTITAAFMLTRTINDNITTHP
jgi:hypothetical protein